MSYASITHGRRAQRKSRRRSILLDSIQNMATIIEENINEVNWNSFVDPRTEQRFDRKVKQRYMSNWEHEQDVFDDELLKSMFHWNPDHYSKLPNKNRKNRNRNSSSGNKNVNIYDSTSYDDILQRSQYLYSGIQNNLQGQYQFPIQNLQVQTNHHVQNNYQVQNNFQEQSNDQDQNIPQLDSIKQFGPPPGLTRPDHLKTTKTFTTSNFSDSASDSEVKTIPSDEELLKDRSAIFATDFSSDSNFSDNYNSDSDFCGDNTGSDINAEQISGYKLNPTAQVFQPRFS